MLVFFCKKERKINREMKIAHVNASDFMSDHVAYIAISRLVKHQSRPQSQRVSVSGDRTPNGADQKDRGLWERDW